MTDRAMRQQKQVDEYTLLSDAYHGKGLFSQGRGIRKHPRESMENYIDRQALAYYLNYTRPIVDATVDPIFRDEVKRDYNDSPFFNAFLEDVDYSGTKLQEFMRRVAVYAKLYGVAYILVNNTDTLSETREGNLANREFPFLKEILPQELHSWNMDEHGRLLEISFIKQEKTTASGIAYVYHRWTTEEWSVHTSSNFQDTDHIISQGVHGLGVVPIVQWFGRSTSNTNMKPPSEFLSIAQTNYSLYQLCSWHTQLLRDQGFSILTFPDDGNLGDSLTIGTDNLLTYPSDSSHSPSFIAPDAAPANMLTDQMDRLIQEIYRMSGMDSVVGVREAKSGVAKQWDFERINQRLADFAVQCESAERKIVQLFELWTGESTDYVAEYPRDFSINDVTESLGQAQTALDLNMGSNTFTVEVAKKVLESYMPNIEPETYDAIISEVESVTEQREQDTMYDTLLNQANMMNALQAGADRDGENQ